MRFNYVFVEAFNNIRRNALVVLGAVLAVFISLFLVFGTLIVGEIVRINTLRWSEDVRVIAFLRDDFRQVEALQATVEDWAEVDKVVYMSKPEAYQEALELLKDRPTALRQIEKEPQLVPASIRISPVELDRYQTIEQRLRNLQGVDEVVSAGSAVDQIIAIRNGLRAFFWVLATALGIAAVALVANTIHMAIYARREELEIMKLVGASSWFVRTPFLLEGMLEGLTGAGLAVGIGASLYRLAVDNLAGLPSFIEVAIGDDFLVQWGVLILIFGLAVGLVGSALSLSFHRYVRA